MNENLNVESLVQLNKTAIKHLETILLCSVHDPLSTEIRAGKISVLFHYAVDLLLICL